MSQIWRCKLWVNVKSWKRCKINNRFFVLACDNHLFRLKVNANFPIWQAETGFEPSPYPWPTTWFENHVRGVLDLIRSSLTSVITAEVDRRYSYSFNFPFFLLYPDAKLKGIIQLWYFLIKKDRGTEWTKMFQGHCSRLDRHSDSPWPASSVAILWLQQWCILRRKIRCSI